jgi:hypothetical protein
LVHGVIQRSNSVWPFESERTRLKVKYRATLRFGVATDTVCVEEM